MLVLLTVIITIYVGSIFTVEIRYKHHIDGFYFICDRDETI